MKIVTRLISATMLLSAATLSHASLISGLGSPNSNAALSGGSVVDFTSVPAGTYTNLTEGGVTFSSGSSNTFVITNNLGGQYNTTGQNLQNLQGQGSTSILNFAFSSTVSAFGFNFGASNEDWKLEAFDSSNGLLESYILPQTWWSNAGEYFGIAASGIASARLTQLTHVNDAGVDWILLDNLTYGGGSVPAPGIVWLLCAGLVGVAWRQKLVA